MEGELKVGSVRLPVRLLDQSAEGFAVLSDEPLDVEVDDLGELRIEAGWFSVQVANTIEVRPAKTDGLAEAENSPSTFRVGLRRLGELDLAREDGSSLAGRCIRFLLAWFFRSGVSMVEMAIILALAVTAGLVVVTVLLWTMDQLLVESATQPSNRASTSSVSPRAAGRKPQRPTPQERSAMPKEATGGQLSVAETEQVHQLVRGTGEAIRESSMRWQESSRQEISQQRAKILADARQEALKMLTEEQRARWLELSK
jgi:hypothetical protein